ncbi:MAG: hypothetical protein QM589_16155 [Thermomicrobiales bacterium]
MNDPERLQASEPTSSSLPGKPLSVAEREQERRRQRDAEAALAREERERARREESERRERQRTEEALRRAKAERGDHAEALAGMSRPTAPASAPAEVSVSPAPDTSPQTTPPAPIQDSMPLPESGLTSLDSLRELLQNVPDLPQAATLPVMQLDGRSQALDTPEREAAVPPDDPRSSWAPLPPAVPAPATPDQDAPRPAAMPPTSPIDAIVIQRPSGTPERMSLSMVGPKMWEAVQRAAVEQWLGNLEDEWTPERGVRLMSFLVVMIVIIVFLLASF